MAKNESDTPQTDSNDGVTEGAVEVGRAVDPTQPSPQAENYKLTKISEEEVPTEGFVELEVVAEGTFRDSNGEICRTGDRKLLNAADAAALLEVKVNGKSAFKEV